MAKLKSRLARNQWELLKTVVAALADSLAPPRCLGCLIENTWLCRRCLSHIGSYELSCIGCEKKHPRGLTCTMCRDSVPLTGVVSVGSYHSVLLRRGISWLKFKGVKDVAGVLAQLLVPRLLVIAPVPQLQAEAVLVPIPLHPRRWRERGFNQSEEIARHVSRLTNIPFATPLVRARSTWTQSHLPQALRQENVTGAFSTTAALPESLKTIVLIDDVTTSGSTLCAAAAPLLAPQRTIWGATIARG